MSVDVSPNAMARCATHPDELAGATCQRCGAFVCGACTTWLSGALYCPACASRPEVNYLETLRLQLWGKRDGSAWFVAGCSLLAVLGAQLALQAKDVPTLLTMLGALGVCICFFLGQRWARYALLLLPVALAIQTAREFGVAMVGVCFFLFLFALQIFMDVRSQLFFRVKVSERALRKLWDLRVNNPLARHAVSLGVIGFFLPPVAPAAVVCGVIALRRVDPEARPPIGRRASSIFGIMLGLGAMAMWLLFIVRLVDLGGLRWLTQH
jgi:hypothetical protein